MSDEKRSPLASGAAGRPNWVALGNSGEQQIVKWGGDPTLSPTPLASPLTTGAFVSRAISTRFEVAPSPWRNLATMVILYGLFIGLPALAGIWAAMRVFS